MAEQTTTDPPSAEVVKSEPEPFTLAPRGVLAEIQRVLLQAMTVVELSDTPGAAEVWRAADILARDLAAVRRAAANRLIDLAPIETYKFRGEVRERPVKSQVVSGVGIVLIEQTPTRQWEDRRELAKTMMRQQIVQAEGEAPDVMSTIDWVFDIFQVGDPRVTALKDRGFGDYDDPDNGFVDKTYARTARVS